MIKYSAANVGDKKKRGLFRSAAGGLARAGGATVKVSLWTGEIVMAANNSANVQQFAATLAVNAAKGKAQDLVIDTVRDSFRTNQKP